VRNAFETLEAHHGSMNGWDDAKPDADRQAPHDDKKPEK
jgi:hypothetical protein